MWRFFVFLSLYLPLAFLIQNTFASEKQISVFEVAPEDGKPEVQMTVFVLNEGSLERSGHGQFQVMIEHRKTQQVESVLAEHVLIRKADPERFTIHLRFDWLSSNWLIEINSGDRRLKSLQEG